jgi:hypothetical protein
MWSVWHTVAYLYRIHVFFYLWVAQVGLQFLNLTSLINKQELMLRVMGVDAKESDPGILHDI